MSAQLDPDQLRRLLRALGELLESRGIAARILIVGGAALNLAGWIPPRSTTDIDVLARLDEERDALARLDSLPASRSPIEAWKASISRT